MSFLQQIQAKYAPQHLITAAKKVKAIPKDFAVQPIKPGQDAEEPMTCGYCGLTWDDAIITSWTPVPSGRCPFEYFHVYPVTRGKRKID